MKTFFLPASLGLTLCLLCSGPVEGRGFGGFRGGSIGGFRAGGAGGYHAESFGGYRGFNSSGYRSASSFGGYRGGMGSSSSYDRSYFGSRGGSVNVEGERGYAAGPRGGMAAGGYRDVTATGPEGRTYSGSRMGGVAVGPYGRMVGGGSRMGMAAGPRGTVAGASRVGFAGARLPTDFGLAHYSSLYGGVAHSTAYWSHGTMAGRAAYVRSGFGWYNCFRPGWYTAHPGAWMARDWAMGAAWRTADWLALAGWWGLGAAPMDYDYGNTVVYQDNNVYVDGQEQGTVQDNASQAITLADQGQQAQAPPEQEWKSLGVFALVQGEEKTSNNLFQLAVNKDGILRGNYYDGLMDSTTPIFGSIDKKTQRAAWSIGKNKDRVFEAGIYNLTQNETPVMIHFGTDRTQQELLVRMDAAKDGKN